MSLRASVWIALALLAAGVAGALWQRRRSQPTFPVPSAAPGPPRPAVEGGGGGLEALRRENERLRAELARLRAGAAPPQGSAAGAAARPAAPAVPVETLLERVRAALASGDAAAYAQAFLALLDAGEPAYPAVIALVRDGGWAPEAWQRDPRMAQALQALYRGLMIRTDRLGGLADAILARGGEPDPATDFALILLSQMGAESLMPRERLVPMLATLLDRPGEDASASRCFAVCALMGRMRAVETLPILERLVSEGSDTERWAALEGIATLGGPEATDAFKRLLDRARGDDQVRCQILQLLARMDAHGANALLREAARSGEARERATALHLLASRPENLPEIRERLKDAGLPAEDRQALLWGLVQGAQAGDRHAEARQAVWDLYEREVALRNDLLRTLVQIQDPRAVQLVVERLRSGQIEDDLLPALYSLDEKTVRRDPEPFRAAAADAALGLGLRAAAFQALHRVDRQGAVDAVLTGFSRLPEEARLQLAGHLSGAGGSEARQALDRIAATDPSEQVRQAAAVR